MVTVVTIEEGGFGAESAAPANLEILEALYGKKLKKEAEKETKETEKEYEGEFGEAVEGGVESSEGAEYEEPAYEGVEGGEETYEEEAPVRRRSGRRTARRRSAGRRNPGRNRRRRDRMMYATRARQARPELFDDRPTIAERLGLAHMDFALAFAAIGLVAFSVFTLGQATKTDVPGSPNYYLERQAIYGIVGVIGMLVLGRIDYSRFRELRVGIYTFVCVSIALVFVVGAAALGSRRSFELPFFSFQPSELAKLLLVLALAGFVIDGARTSSPVRRTIRYLALGFFPAGMVFLQPDLGTALVLVVGTLAVMYFGGVPWTHFAVIGGSIAALIALVLVVAPASGHPVLQEYQEQRLTSFLHPSSDPGGAGYQQDQSMVAIGAGQKTGRGNQATQTRLDFVPERRPTSSSR